MDDSMATLHAGTQARLLAESPTSSGTTEVYGITQTDAILVSLWVSSIAAGSLDVTVYTLTDEGKDVQSFSFPSVTGPTTDLLVRKSGVILQRFRIVVTYGGACSYEIYARAIESAGESSTRILGSTNFQTSQATVSTTPTEIVVAGLTDRNGILLKNWSDTNNAFISDTQAGCTVAEGYPLGPKDALSIDLGAGVSIWARSESGSADIRLVESGG